MKQKKTSSMAKVGIITLPLSYNIGGILQAYALSCLCRGMGHEPYIITRRRSRNIFVQLIVWLKWKATYWASIISRYPIFSSLNQLPLVATQKFKNENIPSCNKIFFSEASISRWATKQKINRFICGSDQIWNPESWPSMEFAFAQFKNIANANLYSYAPSLGHSENRFSSSQAQKISEYLKRFSSISCREASGVEIISRITNNDILHVLDPTFLISKTHYSKICANATFKPEYKYMFIYLLDISIEQCQMISNIASKYSLIPVSFYPINYKSIFSRNHHPLSEYGIRVIKYPSPENWLQAIKSSSFVITDSFHGTVFSLIFNTPFISLINSKRGAARFLDLQKVFDIDHLFVDKYDTSLKLNKIPADIEWKKINSLIKIMSSRSLSFLKDFNS